MISDLPETAKVWIAAIIAGIVGRLMAHVQEVQAGNRKFWGVELLWEIPTAHGMAFIALGAAEWAGLEGNVQISVIVMASLLGPRGVTSILDRMLASRRA